jgi:hypothetical protein
MSVAEVGQNYRKNESSIHSAVLNSVLAEHSQFFLNSSFLGTIYPQIPTYFLFQP